MTNAKKKKKRKTIEWERLQISLRKLDQGNASCKDEHNKGKGYPQVEFQIKVILEAKTKQVNSNHRLSGQSRNP